MLKERIKNLNIDLLAKYPIKINNKIEIEKIKIQSIVDTKIKDKNKIEDRVKRNKWKLMRLIGQNPVLIKAKKSVAEWSIRKDMIIGNQITIRGINNIERLYKLLLISLPKNEQITKIFEKEKYNIGIDMKKNDGEILIVINDWSMGDFIEKKLGGTDKKKSKEILNELKEIKLLNIGMNIVISSNIKKEYPFPFSIIKYQWNYLLLPKIL